MLTAHFAHILLVDLLSAAIQSCTVVLTHMRSRSSGNNYHRLITYWQYFMLASALLTALITVLIFSLTDFTVLAILDQSYSSKVALGGMYLGILAVFTSQVCIYGMFIASLQILRSLFYSKVFVWVLHLYRALMVALNVLLLVSLVYFGLLDPDNALGVTARTQVFRLSRAICFSCEIFVDLITAAVFLIRLSKSQSNKGRSSTSPPWIIYAISLDGMFLLLGIISQILDSVKVDLRVPADLVFKVYILFITVHYLIAYFYQDIAREMLVTKIENRNLPADTTAAPSRDSCILFNVGASANGDLRIIVPSFGNLEFQTRDLVKDEADSYQARSPGCTLDYNHMNLMQLDSVGDSRRPLVRGIGMLSPVSSNIRTVSAGDFEGRAFLSPLNVIVPPTESYQTDDYIQDMDVEGMPRILVDSTTQIPDKPSDTLFHAPEVGRPEVVEVEPETQTYAPKEALPTIVVFTSASAIATSSYAATASTDAAKRPSLGVGINTFFDRFS